MKKTYSVLLVLCLSALACRLVAPSSEATPLSALVTQPGSAAADTPAPTVPPTLDPALSGELQATLKAALLPTATPDGEGMGGGIESVAVFPLEVPEGSPPLWAAYSLGSRSYEPMQNHFAAIYTRDSAGWKELARLELEETDYTGEGSVQQVQVEPGHTWLRVDGGIGAHGGCFSLIQYDGQALQKVLGSCTDTPLAGDLRDLNGDGILEVLLNASDNYVFCYACGVRNWYYQVWRWDGSRMAEVQLNRMPQPGPEELSQLNDRAVDLARGELWKDARETIRKAAQIAPDDETVAGNAALIELIAETRAKAAQEPESPYSLLLNIFYGDYAAALELFRPYGPEQIFNPQTPLVAGTTAEGWESNLRDYVADFTGKALQAMPDLAAAYYLRAWATYLVDPSDPGILPDLEMAAQLDPGEKLYIDALSYLK